MINTIVNNSLNNVQLSTSKVDNSQSSGSGFEILMNLAGMSNDISTESKNGDVDTNELIESENTEQSTSNENALVSILLLNNSFMQLFNNNLTVNGQMSDESISSMLSGTNLNGISLEDIKQALELIKSKLSGEQVQSADNSFALMQKIFDTKTDAQSLNTFTSKIIEQINVKSDTLNISSQATNTITAETNSGQSNPSTIINISNKTKLESNSAVIENLTSINAPVDNTQNISKSTNEQVNASNVSSNTAINKTVQASVSQSSNSSQAKADEQNNTQNTTQSQSNTVATTNVSNGSGEQSNNSQSNSEQKKQAQNFEKQIQEFAINSSNTVNETNTQAARVSMINEEYDEQGRVNVNDIPRYVNKLIKDMPSNSTQQAKLYLEPANLGKLTINITLTGNTATINFKADSKEAVQSIESQLSALKDKLNSNGIKIESAEVEQQTTNSNADTSGNRSNEGGSSQQEESGIKKEYLNTFRGVNLDNLTDDELPTQANSNINNGSLERYI